MLNQKLFEFSHKGDVLASSVFFKFISLQTNPQMLPPQGPPLKI